MGRRRLLLRRVNKQSLKLVSGYMLAGAISSLCLPPFGLLPLIAVLSWPAICLVRATRIGEAMRVGWTTGFGWFLFSSWWIAASMVTGKTGHWPLFPLAVLFVPFLLSLFWCAAAAISWRLANRVEARLIWFLVVLAMVEWARGYVATGFPWNAPGYAFSAHLSLLQTASVMGLYALNLLAVSVAMIPAFWYFGWRRSAIFVAALVPVLAGAGMWRLASHAEIAAAEGASKYVRMVQPAVPQAEKWDRNRRTTHLERLQRLSTAQTPVPQLVIWPETAFAGLLDVERDLFRRTVAGALPVDGVLITGVPRRHSRTKLLNSAIMVGPDGEIEAEYDKKKLVPFGEFFPFRNLFPFATAIVGPMDFTHGTTDSLFSVPRYGVFRPLICYEAIFPGVAGGLGVRPDLLLNLTNDAWFGGTQGPYQHLEQARMRAVEEGIPMVRVANTGVSAAFDSYGRTLARIEMGVAGFADLALPDPTAVTFYARWRETTFVIGLILLTVLAIRLDRRLGFGH